MADRQRGQDSGCEEPQGTGALDLEAEEGRLLDGFLLLAAGGSASPDDVVSANLASLKLVDVADEDLTFFKNLDRLDVSDNRLGNEHILRQFGRLPRLSSLSLACNALTSVQVTSGTLSRLEILDLSYNGLNGEALSQLVALPRLRTLNLASNCINWLPRETELIAMQALEELNLDNNDLVQFVQWRALDVLPRLRRLSLASNRVKHLKDDVAERDALGQTYFRALEELDLSSNEISCLEHLTVVPLFQALKVLKLNNNPVVRASQPPDPRMSNVKLCATQTRQWYLCGNGCFQRRPAKEPRLKLDRRRLRRVRSMPAAGPRQRRAAQICLYDEETNALVVNLKEQAAGLLVPPSPVPGTRKPPLLPPLPAAAAPALPALSDDISEDELDQLLKERFANIQAKFEESAEEPASFRRRPPFAASASETANEKFGLRNQVMLHDQAASQLFNLTSLGEDSGARAFREHSESLPCTDMASSATVRPRLATAGIGSSSSSTAAAAFAAALLEEPTCDPKAYSPFGGTVALPLVTPRSRGSSASGSRSATPSRGAALPSGGGRLAPLQPPPVGVREAMRAIRAAATQYAVGAF